MPLFDPTLMQVKASPRKRACLEESSQPLGFQEANPMSASKIKTLARDGGDAVENVADHLKTMVAHLGDNAGDAASVAAAALSHAAIELVADVQRKLDRLEADAAREVRRHPVETLTGATVGAALVAAAAASLITYALTRPHRA